MDVFILLLTFLPCALLCYINKDLLARRVALLFLLIWCFLLVLSVFNPYNLKPVRPLTYLYLCTFVIMVLIGMNISTARVSYRTVPSYSKASLAFNHLATNKWMLVVVVIADAFLLFFCLKLRELLETMSALDYRNTGGLQNDLFGGNSLIGLTYTFLVTPMTFFANVFFAYLILFNRKASLPISLYALFIILRSYLESQRSGLVDVFIFIIFFVFCCPFFMSGKSNKKLAIKNIILIGAVSVISFALLSFMTNQRLNNENTFSMSAVYDGVGDTCNHLVLYSIGPFRAFDYALINHYTDRLGGHSYGLSTLGFVDYSLQLVSNNLGINYDTANGRIYKLLQDNWISIPHNFNFAYTAVFNFYMDFGFLGILVIPFVLGCILKRFIVKFTHTSNPIALLVVAYIFYVLANCYFTWRMYEMSAMVTILWLLIINRMLKKYI